MSLVASLRDARGAARDRLSPPATTYLRQFQCRSAGLPSVNSIPDCASQFLSVNVNLVTFSRCRAGASGTLMILPQVHLRKPCYDFYFL